MGNDGSSRNHLSIPDVQVNTSFVAISCNYVLHRRVALAEEAGSDERVVEILSVVGKIMPPSELLHSESTGVGIRLTDASTLCKVKALLYQLWHILGVDEETCKATVCHDIRRICPAGALHDGFHEQRYGFYEGTEALRCLPAQDTCLVSFILLPIVFLLFSP